MKNAMIAGGTMLAALAFSPAQAQPTDHVTHVRTTAELGMVCDPQVTGVPRLESIAYCQGFLNSFGQYHSSAHPAGRPGQLFCVTNPGPSIAESGLSFARWSRSNPQRAAEPALDGLLRWAEATHPCPTPAAAPRRTSRNAR